MQRDEIAAWLRLTIAPGVGNISARKLLAAFGLPQAVFAQSLTALGQLVSAAQANSLRAVPEGLDALTQATLDWLAGTERDGVYRHMVTLADPLYPFCLLALDDPPLVLYVTGSAAVFEAIARKPIANDIAIVGTRNPTPQGQTNAREFAYSLAASGLHVVSGLALGVDGGAHAGALDAFEASPQTAGSTVAVVGTGLDRVYPKRHYELAHRIVQHGIMLSEFPVGTPPLPPNFPKRNRIISALTQGTLVVEAAVKSGSLITARLAAEQGKDVFAIPGSIHSTLSKGCHLLIKQGAKLVESADDVLGELTIPVAGQLSLNIRSQRAKAQGVGAHDNEDDNTGGSDTAEHAQVYTDPQAAPSESDLLQALGHDPVSLDALIARTGIDTPTLQARLLELELDGEVARLPGGLFQRQMRA